MTKCKCTHGHINDRLGRGLWRHTAHSVWTGEFLFCHINCLELRAVSLALINFLPFLRRCHVIVRMDNMAVVSRINRQGGSRSRTLNRLACHLLLWSRDKFLSLRAVHVLVVLNLGPWTSQALFRGVLLEDICVAVGWSSPHTSGSIT